MQVFVIDVKKILNEGIFLKTTGSTGIAKTIFQNPKKISSGNAIARKVQKINASSKILTVCSLQHAGGLLAQTLPGIEVGAYVEILPFNAFKWAEQIKKFTHTHLTPQHIELLRKTKSWGRLDLSHLRITCGSDIVTPIMIEESLAQGAVFTVNWGMTEVGPCAINRTFYPGDQIPCYQDYFFIGSEIHCEYKFVDSCLVVKGDICVYDDWFNTGDVVVFKDGNFFFGGRKQTNDLSDRRSLLNERS